MRYGIRELSELAGVSARTLRYYDEIGLLKPLFVNEAGYRFYGEEEAELLQQILFYRERGFGLKQIEALKERAIKENEAQYGAEIREKYGEDCVEASNEKVKGMAQEEWEQFQGLEKEILKQLKENVLAKISFDQEKVK